MINCLVVDDEPIAREGMKEYISQIDYLNLAADYKSASEAAGILQKNKIDLIFLDIQMPGLTGIEFVKALAEPPAIIFTTAYPQYAIEGYELNIIDYLLKPISFARFLRSVEKAQSYLKAKTNNLNITNEFFFIKCNGKIEKILISEVIYIEAMANYVIVHTNQKKYITYITFSGINKHLPEQHFMRIHKSYMVALAAIKTIDGDEIITSIARLPLAKSFREQVMKRIGHKLIKR